MRKNNVVIRNRNEQTCVLQKAKRRQRVKRKKNYKSTQTESVNCVKSRSREWERNEGNKTQNFSAFTRVVNYKYSNILRAFCQQQREVVKKFLENYLLSKLTASIVKFHWELTTRLIRLCNFPGDSKWFRLNESQLIGLVCLPRDRIASLFVDSWERETTRVEKYLPLLATQVSHSSGDVL